MKRLVLATLFSLFATSAFAQTHPCDGTPATSGTAVQGAPITLTACHDGKDANGNTITITGWAVYDNGVRTTPTLTPGTTVNTAGLRDYNVTFPAPAAGVHTYQAAAISAQGEAANKSIPFALTVTLPLTTPSTAVKVHIR